MGQRAKQKLVYGGSVSFLSWLYLAELVWVVGDNLMVGKLISFYKEGVWVIGNKKALLKKRAF